MIKKYLKYLIVIAMLGAMWLPLTQQYFKFYNERKLLGAYTMPDYPVFSDTCLMSTVYRSNFEKYQDYYFGFRPELVRFKNSIDFILYKETIASDVVVGKNGILFSKGFMKSTFGIDYNGKRKNDSTLFKINYMKERLQSLGKNLLVVMAPSKESFYIENVPYDFMDVRDSTNSMDYIQGYKKYHIPYIDFATVFRQMKDTSRFPLFSEAGVHWTIYGAKLATDSMLHFMQKHLKDPMPEYVTKGIEISDTARGSDNDYENPMNLFFTIRKKKLAYPIIQPVEQKDFQKRPKVIIIGDSFFWTVSANWILVKVFSEDTKFWFYYKTSYPNSSDSSVPIEQVDIVKELESADYVILFGSQSTSPNFPYGVTDDYYAKTKDLPVVK